MLDVFKSDAFSVTTLTDWFVKAPYKPGRIGALGLFKERGIRTTTAVIEYKDGSLSLIPTSPRGGPGSTLSGSKRTAVSVVVPHLEKESTILADEIQGVRAFGSEDATPAIQAIVQERLADLRADHEVTLEHLRISALQGIVLDADGSTLLNLFTTFGVSQTTGSLAYDDVNDDGDRLRQEIRALQRTIEGKLGAAPISGYRAFCGQDFFDNLRSDRSIANTLRYADPGSLLADRGTVFNFGGVAWEEYRGSVSGQDFVPPDEAYLFPEGVDIFRTYFAPADYIETVNTLGLPGYAKTINDPELNRWVKVHTQSNPLAICLRPDAVVKVTLTT